MAHPDHEPDPTADPLPGEEQVDPDLVAVILARLEPLSRGQGLPTALAIADAVLDHLFAGDPARFRTRSHQHQTFRALQSDEALPLSRSSLWYALAVRDQHDQLPSDVADKLSLAHHKVLLRVKARHLKVEVARKAAKESLSKRDLERYIRRRVSKEQVRGRGRPRLPAIVKGIRKVEQATDLATSEPISATLLRRLDKERIQGLLSSLDDNIEALEQLGAKLRELASKLED